ncbi:MAG: dihydroorotate dehydrogenase (quinone) [Deltaproteobacteria bacterium]|nr:dihydroorotate dehydrogenase (quinone) [Deltaproteobacteria bacterium]
MKHTYAPIGLYSLCKPLLFRIPPEKAHKLSLRALGLAGSLPPARYVLKRFFSPDTQSLSLFGHTFINRIGMAAGYDKNAQALDGLEGMGFGHIEVGTITPKPQKGNPNPRVHRLPQESALVNRLGFPNDGLDIIAKRIESYCNRRNKRYSGPRPILGINIGKNKTTANAQAYLDYKECFTRLKDVADYITINVSSPNTPNLRALQSEEELEKILTPILDIRQKSASHVPILVKLSPNLEHNTRTGMIQKLVEWSVDGVILSNTTKTSHPWEGGKSGAPLHDATLSLIQETRSRFPNLVIIASGGIGLDGDLQTFIEAGADLIQIWTALVYRGPYLLRRL